ncbi:hypothetical protein METBISCDRAFT_25601 [Metschnikowia bicuspidata]|uniref:Alpha-1,6-mannosyltransferase n=1 Tax=Metschnikowia bicuspidata TaxID=27322 RepID=A0A4P9ZHM9_9ASCO|nr:hypothetical protein METBISCDRAFT_25601 [Metschnikowia bicuspidata]
MKKPSFASRRKPLIITVTLVCIIFAIANYTTWRSKDALMLSNINGIFLLVFSENDKKQEEFYKRIEKLQNQFMANQNERLAVLQKQNAQMLDTIQAMRIPPSHLNIRDKLIFMLPYDPTAKFPGYIWQTWKYGLNDDNFIKQYRDGEKLWAGKNPGFVHEVFNDETSYAFVKHLYAHVPEVILAYDALPDAILKIDFFKYLVLFARGGVYADIDTMPLQPIPNWIPDNVSPTEIGLIISVGSESNSPQWNMESRHRRLEFGQFVIQAKPGHPILREIIAQITTKTSRKQRKLRDGDLLSFQDNSNDILLELSRWTGSGAWTDVIFEILNDYVKSSHYKPVTWKEFHDLATPKLVSDVLVFPIKSFASDIEVSRDGKITDAIAFVKHYGDQLWKES